MKRAKFKWVSNFKIVVAHLICSGQPTSFIIVRIKTNYLPQKLKFYFMKSIIKLL